MSIDGAAALIEGWAIARPAGCPDPLAMAGEILAGFGAAVSERETSRSDTLEVIAPSGRRVEVRLAGWIGEGVLACARPRGRVLGAYAALRLAGAAVFAGGRGIDTCLGAAELACELTAPGRMRGGSRPELVRCRDGWVVVRWRDAHERALFESLIHDARPGDRDEIVATARLARLLVAPVEPPPSTPAPVAQLGTGSLGGESATVRRRRPRVVDWSVLWAGPWAAAQLRRSGSAVDRVEHPRRRDGLLTFPDGRRWWRALNGDKRISLLDGRDPRGRRQLEAAIGTADILLTSMTPRALASLGFDEGWRLTRAPHLLHLELVAFEDPWADAPGLGEHAAARAGLLWRDGGPPGELVPWADPLLGASALAISRIWLASRSRPGGRVRLSLERAASLAFAATPASV